MVSVIYRKNLVEKIGWLMRFIRMVIKKKSSEYYTDEEITEIYIQWVEDKARIDKNPAAYGYYVDKDKEYERHLNNSNLRTLFRHAAYLYHGLHHNEVSLFQNEKALVIEVYKGILKNGYFDKSKTREKKIRAWFGKASSRQSYRRYKRR